MTSVHIHAMYAGICMHLWVHVCVHDLRSCTASHSISHSCSPNPHCLRCPQLSFYPFGLVWTVACIFPLFISGDCDKQEQKGQKMNGTFRAGSTEKHPSSLWWGWGTHQKTCRKQISYSSEKLRLSSPPFFQLVCEKITSRLCPTSGWARRLGCEANSSTQRKGEADSLQTIKLDRRQTRLFYLKRFLLV